MARYRSNAITAKKAFCRTQGEEKETRRKHPEKEMSCLSERKLANMLGTVEVTYQISRKEKLASRIYMGWRL